MKVLNKKPKVSTIFQRYTAFTLAEVLITLGIIGVVAAITLPTLINAYQNTQYIVALKKNYTTFQNGMKMYMAKSDCTDLPCTGLFEGVNTSSTPTADAFVQIFSGMQSLGISPASLSSYSAKYLKKIPCNTITFYTATPTFQMSDGSFYNIRDYDAGNCTANSGATAGKKLKNSCAEVVMDINGNKSPNKWGRDIFYFILGSDGVLYPSYGADYFNVNGTYWRTNEIYCGTAGTNAFTTNTEGGGCAARIIEEGWEMNY